MGTLFVDFNTHTLNAYPSTEFTDRLGPSYTTEVIETPASLDPDFGARSFLVGSSTGPNRSFTGHELLGSVESGDTEITTIVNQTEEGVGPTLYFRTRDGVYDATNGDTVTGYGVVVHSLFVGVYKWIDSHESDAYAGLTSQTYEELGITDSTNVRLTSRLREAEGTVYIDVWVWDVGDEKPASPNFTYTDSSPIAAGGWIGIGTCRNTASTRSTHFGFVGFGNGADPAPTSGTTYGIRITDIKEPNEADTLVTGVTNARVKVWIGTNDSDWEDEIRSNLVIEDGVLEVTVSPEEGFTLNDTVTVEVMWTVGTERKLFITETTVVDLEGGS